VLRSAYPAVQPSMLSIAEWGGMLRVWNEIEALKIEVREGMHEQRMQYRFINADCGAPILA
jgi:hypothetical protein